MAKIAIDVDDTIYPFGDLARQIILDEAAKTGDKIMQKAAYASWPEWRTPVDLLGQETWLSIIDKCHDEEIIGQQIPYANSQLVLRELAQDHELIYVSSRSMNCFAATEAWLDDNDFPEGELICSGHDKTKHIASCQYIIDDRPSTLVRFVYDYDWTNRYGSAGDKRIAYGLMADYNRALTDVPNIYLAPPGNWMLLRGYLVKTGVLKELAYA